MHIEPSILGLVREHLSAADAGIALRLALTGGVSLVSRDRFGDEQSIVAEVSAALDTFEAEVRFYNDGSVAALCSCGVSRMCAHVGAALLAFDVEGNDAAPAATPPDWQRELDSVLPGPTRSSSDDELCLFLTVVPATAASRYSPGRAPQLAMRPGMLGKREKWIKGRARWGELQRLDASTPRHRLGEHLSRLSVSPKRVLTTTGEAFPSGLN